MNLQEEKLLERFHKLKELTEKFVTGSESDKSHKVLISIGYETSRAVVFAGVGSSYNAAYNIAQKKAERYINSINVTPPWIKADYVTKEEILTQDEFVELASKAKKHYFNCGISFDANYNNAFLSQEVNMAALIKYREDSTKRWPKNEKIDSLAGDYKDYIKGIEAELNYKNINWHIKQNRKLKYAIDPNTVNDIIVFQTESYFSDGESYFEMDTTPLCKEHRVFDNLSREIIMDLIDKSALYLKSTVKHNGEFVYGYFSCYDKVVPKYNSIRHALGVLALAESYNTTKNEALLAPTKRALEYVFKNLLYEKDDMCFLVDMANNHEIRLGANSVLILAMVECMKIFEVDDSILSLLDRLGNGILFMQNKETGQFTHVIDFPTLEVVDEFRIVYYSGEASYALMRLYSVDKNEKWLNGVKKAFDFFIENDYYKYNDHWLAYCTNELTAIVPEDKYFNFGLQNTFYKINYIINRITTWPTFLEMLIASKTMVENIEKAGKSYLFEGYDMEKLYYAIDVRLHRQLNGVFFPEVAMYLKNPKRMLYGVFIRHHSFRVRNDDVAHHLSGYCHYLDVYSEL